MLSSPPSPGQPKTAKRKKPIRRTAPKHPFAMPISRLTSVAPLSPARLEAAGCQTGLTYRLESLNSLTLSEGKIGSLLLQAEKSRTERKVRCRCSKSKCESNYCECYSNGRICGSDCDCLNCKNIFPNDHVQKNRADRGCRCSRSQCLKNYCECYQRGEPCSEKCSCVNCKNQSL